MRRVHGLLALLLLLGARAQATGSLLLPEESAVPGGIKILRLSATGDVPPYVEADGHRALVVEDQGVWMAVIGIPLSAQVGPFRVTARDAAGPHEIDFAVADKHYL